jgi:hypothetical protein
MHAAGRRVRRRPNMIRWLSLRRGLRHRCVDDGARDTTFALFVLAVQLLILTIVGTLPLVLPQVAFAAVAAILTGAGIGTRAAGRGARPLRLRRLA